MGMSLRPQRRDIPVLQQQYEKRCEAAITGLKLLLSAENFY